MQFALHPPAICRCRLVTRRPCGERRWLLLLWTWLATVVVWIDAARTDAQLRRLPSAQQDRLWLAEAAPREAAEDAQPAARFPIGPPEVPHSWGEPGDLIPLPEGIQVEGWQRQWFPDGLIYRSYLGSVREPRFASVWSYEKDFGWLWDVALGGRVGIVRYGDTNEAWPNGWQVDMEGAAFPRLDPDGPSTPLLSTDFRFGIPITYGCGRFRFKTGYYHLSSHLGDEFMLANPDVERSNYSRDAMILAVSYYLGDDFAWRPYAEVTWADWANSRGGVAQPWEFQFGIDYSPACGFDRGSPFATINAHLREEANFGGHMSVQVGWQFRRGYSGRLFRMGGEYVNGKSTQASFFREHENRLGLGMWYDY